MSCQKVKVEIVNDDEIVILKTITLKTNVERMGKFFEDYKNTRDKSWYYREVEDICNNDYGIIDQFIKHFELKWNHKTGDLILDVKDDESRNIINEKDIDKILKCIIDLSV